MIIARTPLRISFVGGGSDLPAFYRKENGAVLGTAINKYMYITVNPKFDGKIRASYSVTEIVDRREDIQHELIREALAATGIKGGIEITSISDIPSEGTGLGSSSSYAVGLLHALWAYRSKHVSAGTLAETACRIELSRLKKPMGKQDQYFAAFGGLSYIEFFPGGRVEVSPLICRPRTKRLLEENLLLFYTGITRPSHSILREQVRNVGRKQRERDTTRKMVAIASHMRECIQGNDLRSFGELLHENWLLKRTLASSISNPKIDAWYGKTLRLGALGGKVVGAGGGGFLLFYAPKDRHKAIVKGMSDLRHIPFQFEPQGSNIIYVG